MRLFFDLKSQLYKKYGYQWLPAFGFRLKMRPDVSAFSVLFSSGVKVRKIMDETNKTTNYEVNMKGNKLDLQD